MVSREHMQAIKRVYYWKGMRKDILKYCKGCSQCAKHRVEKRKFIEQSFKPGAQPMEFIFHGLSWGIPPTIIKRGTVMHLQLSVC